MTHATRAYDLPNMGAEGISALTRDMKYIYPPSPNASIHLLMCIVTYRLF